MKGVELDQTVDNIGNNSTFVVRINYREIGASFVFFDKIAISNMSFVV